MSVGFAKSKETKKIRLADFGDAEFIEVELSLESGSYGAAVGYVEITGVAKK
jgi:hypothetical protein